jgi:hypothetical protein
VAGAVEVFVVLDEWQVAGTFDRLLLRQRDRRTILADLKTGANLDFSWQSFAAQLAAYSRGVRYDVDTGTRTPLDVDQEVGLIIHLPANEERCELHEVDLTVGWQAFERSMWVREWRKAKDFHRSIGGVERPVDDAQPAPELLERARALSAHRSDATAWCQQRWPEGCPRLTEPLTGAQRDAVAALLDEAETYFSAPFNPQPQAEPIDLRPSVERQEWQRPRDGAEVDAESMRAEMARLAEHWPELVAWCQAIFGEARACGRAIVVDRRHTERSYAIMRALIAVGRYADLDDELVRQLLAATLGTDGALHPVVSVGQCFGSLTIDEANRLAEVAERCAGGRITIAFDLEGAPALSGDLTDLVPV